MKTVNEIEVNDEDELIQIGLEKGDESFEKIMNEYRQSGWYNDDTGIISSSQFLCLFHHFGKLLVERGWNKEELERELSLIFANCYEEDSNAYFTYH